MSVIFLIPVYMTYWPRKWNRCCVPRSDSFHQLIRQSIAYVIALLSLIHYVTLWPWPLTFVSGHACRVTWSTPPPPSSKILLLSVLELWVLTYPIGYHRQCISSHCACSISHDLCVGGNFSDIFEIPGPDLPIHYTTCMALRLRQTELSAKTAYFPPLNTT